MEGLGVDTLLLIHFDKQFSQQTGEEFIRGLARDLGALQSICVGANFVFGYKRGGNVELLKKLGEELKFTVHGLAAVALDGKPVSSTRINFRFAGLSSTMRIGPASMRHLLRLGWGVDRREPGLDFPDQRRRPVGL